MKLPSIFYILSAGKRAASRFPLALLAAFISAFCAMVLVGGDRDSETLVRLLMVSQLAIPLMVALAVVTERGGKTVTNGIWLPVQLAGIAVLTIYFFTLPSKIELSATMRFIQFNIGAHLLVAFLPYLRAAETNGFWQFNKTLFLRLLAGIIFSATLFVGLAIALLALDQLFGADIPEETYPRLWILVVFVFNTWYFVAGVPADRDGLAQLRDYPGVIRVFAQYILAPLVAIYLSILLAYLVKVIVTTQWPSGWIGYLVSSVAVAGLFSLVLLHPLVEQAENRWVNTYARYFYVFMLPAVFMLLLAIYKRVAQYGITENRYFLAVLALWLLFICAHGLLGKKRTIKIIPMTLCLVAFFSAFGPWGAYSVSRTSQTQRLTGLLENNRLMAEGRLVPARSEVSLDDREEISAVFDYLIDRHGVETVSPWFDEKLAGKVEALCDSLSGNGRYHNNELTRAVLGHMDLEYVGKYERTGPPGYQWYQIERESDGETIDVSTYDIAYTCQMPWGNTAGFEINGTTYQIERAGSDIELVITSSGTTVLLLDLAPVLENLREYSDTKGKVSTAPGGLMTLTAESEGLRAKFLINDIYWSEIKEEIHVDRLKATVLLSESR